MSHNVPNLQTRMEDCQYVIDHIRRPQQSTIKIQNEYSLFLNLDKEIKLVQRNKTCFSYLEPPKMIVWPFSMIEQESMKSILSSKIELVFPITDPSSVNNSVWLPWMKNIFCAFSLYSQNLPVNPWIHEHSIDFFCFLQTRLKIPTLNPVRRKHGEN